MIVYIILMGATTIRLALLELDVARLKRQRNLDHLPGPTGKQCRRYKASALALARPPDV